MTALRREFDDSSPRAPGSPGAASTPARATSTRATSKKENQFDLGALLDGRGSEGFALHERYVNPQMPRVLRTIGFDADYVRAEGAYLFDRDGRRHAALAFHRVAPPAVTPPAIAAISASERSTTVAAQAKPVAP